jgi:hypothetical protein
MDRKILSAATGESVVTTHQTFHDERGGARPVALMDEIISWVEFAKLAGQPSNGGYIGRLEPRMLRELLKENIARAHSVAPGPAIT